jgi:hypothetical protein
MAGGWFQRRVVLLQIVGHFSLSSVRLSSKTTGLVLIAICLVVRKIDIVGVFLVIQPYVRRLDAKQYALTAIYNLCSTVGLNRCFFLSPYSATPSPIKDRP